ncbi:sensor histidine kinase [Clostridium sp. YIM B02505]|uniref:histidine kinase n=1 Tax=Clostridium yunnanense TaxID=2800325 RepID=A0ABS1EQ46_9CLOT|nr:sensor histidine kinase [Clostridium yunnanense]MBK1811494.1 sensor histidine kinase [Clostridium yunnanense]
MKKKLIIDFLKDNIGYTVTFYISIGVVLLYYFITGDIRDITYPILITSIIFIIFLSIQFVKFYSFNINIKDSINSEKNKMFEGTNEQKYFLSILKDLQEEYLKEISRMSSDSSTYKYFISQWIHNMKTPVSIISLVLQKAKYERENLEEEKNDMDKALEEIGEENSKLQNGLEQLLNLLRMEQFVKDYEPEEVNLLNSIKELINSKKSLFIYNNVFPQIQCEDASITVLTDEKWNKFLIEQIISNAVKYSSEEGKKKFIKFKIDKFDNKVKLDVIDQGIGISKIDLNRVFEPFFTGENGRKFKAATGIGLYVCDQLSKNLNHKLMIESEKGKGTKVSIIYYLNATGGVVDGGTKS